MVRAKSLNQAMQMAGPSAANPHLVNFWHWLSVSTATAALIGLSIFNAMHGPIYDCVRASAYLLRTRRGPIVSLMQVESAERFIGVVHSIPVLTPSLKESIHDRD